VRVAGAVVGHAGPDDVVGEHGLHVGAGLLVQARHVPRAVEALLLAGDRGEHDRRLGLAGGEHPRHLHRDGHPGRVVVGARRVGGPVEHVGDPRVVVPGHDVHALGRGLSAQGRHHVGDPGRHRDAAAVRLLDVGLQLHGHPTAGGLGVLLHLREDPVARGADAPRRVVLRRQRVPGAERHELAHVLLDPPPVELAQDAQQFLAGALRQWWPVVVIRCVIRCAGRGRDTGNSDE
jgi:hypothetical protein